MRLHLLTPLFYRQNIHLKEALDINTGLIKMRGYGILIISYQNLRFGLPLRSHISHKNCFLTEGTKGLDYTKAVLLTNNAYIDHKAFTLPEAQFKKIRQNESLIEREFKKYVNTYRRMIKNQDIRLFKDYKYSTLINYHKELHLI